MSKIKEFIKWTDIALSLKEMFDEVKGALKDHEEEFRNLQNQNMLLLQQVKFQNQTIEELKARITCIEDRQEIIINNPSTVEENPKELPRDID
ncbi:MAG: hypothetical protein AB2692_23265 [Candidatus Thiodiazotropha sp.]